MTWLIAYGVGFLVAWRILGRWFMLDFAMGGRIDGECVAMGLFMGAVFASIWPVVLPPYLLAQGVHRRERDWESVGRLLLGESREQKIGRLERERDERERRIARLERELRIGQADHNGDRSPFYAPFTR